MRFGVDCNQKEQIVGIVGRGMVAIHSSGQNIFCFTHIEGFTLVTDEIAGGRSGMGVNRIGEVCDRTGEG